MKYKCFCGSGAQGCVRIVTFELQSYKSAVLLAKISVFIKRLATVMIDNTCQVSVLQALINKYSHIAESVITMLKTFASSYCYEIFISYWGNNWYLIL